MNTLLSERVNPYQKEINKASKKIFLDVKYFWDSFIFRLVELYNNPSEFEDGFGTEDFYVDLDDFMEYGIYKSYISIPNKHDLKIPIYLGAKFKKNNFSQFQNKGWHITGHYAGYSSDIGYVKLQLYFNFDDLETAKNPNWDEVYFAINHLIAHEYEHALQDHLGIDRVNYDLSSDNMDRKYGLYLGNIDLGDGIGASRIVNYYTELASEIEAELQANWLLSKRLRNTKKYKGKSRAAVFTDYINANLKTLGFTLKEINYVIKKWKEYAKDYFPYMKFS